MSTTLIPVTYDVVKADLTKHLAAAVAHASFTTDGWTVSNNVAFSGVMLHYIDKEFNAINKCVAVIHTPGSHTLKVLAHHTTEILSEFGVKLDTSSHHNRQRGER